MGSLDSLGGKGKEEISGRGFTLSSTRQLQEFQNLLLHQEGNFALKIVQGLVAAEAIEVRCVLGRLGMSITATGCDHSGPGLQERLAGKLGVRRDAGDDLALGVVGALGLRITEIGWQLAQGETVAMDRYGVRHISDTNKSDETTLTFKYPILSFTESIRAAIRIRASAHQLISVKCCYSPVPVYLGSKRIKPIAGLPDDGVLFEPVYFLDDRTAPGTVLKLIAHGVEVYSELHDLDCSPGVVVASAEGLTFDQGTLTVVQDDKFGELLARIRRSLPS